MRRARAELRVGLEPALAVLAEPAGVELERQVMVEARKGKMRIIGPNCLGVMSPTTGLNATFATTIARRGTVGFISQSGALCTAILDWANRNDVGFSSVVSMGSSTDVDFGEITATVEPVLKAELDHRTLNDVPGLENPTAEVLCGWLWQRLAPHLPRLSAITVHETCTARCTYRGE